VALDMVYRTGETPWVRAMRASRRRAADGRGMLVAQGAGALHRWFPGVEPPTEIMRAAVGAALR
jgi:shikimate 5-dehydrogenase